MLGRELPVRSSASAEKVQAVETFVNGRLHEIGAALMNADAQLVLTLALLNTAEELIDLREAGKVDACVNEKLQTILRQLEAV